MAKSETNWVLYLQKSIDSWKSKNVVISPDIDGFLCYLLFSELYDANLIGIYTTNTLVLFDHYDGHDALSALWLDHDIAHSKIQSIGQHIIQNKLTDPLSFRKKNSFNPNVIWSKSRENSFLGKSKDMDKYPFGTIHFLMQGLMEDSEPQNSEAFALLAHADSSWMNSINYSHNCKLWFGKMFNGKSRLIEEITSKKYCTKENLLIHSNILNNLEKLGLSQFSSGRTFNSKLSSGWEHIKGFQTLTFNHLEDPLIYIKILNAILNYLSEIMGWKTSNVIKINEIFKGAEISNNPNHLFVDISLDEWVEQCNIFSYAFIFKDKIKFTSQLEKKII